MVEIAIDRTRRTRRRRRREAAVALVALTAVSVSVLTVVRVVAEPDGPASTDQAAPADLPGLPAAPPARRVRPVGESVPTPGRGDREPGGAGYVAPVAVSGAGGFGGSTPAGAPDVSDPSSAPGADPVPVSGVPDDEPASEPEPDRPMTDAVDPVLRLVTDTVPALAPVQVGVHSLTACLDDAVRAAQHGLVPGCAALD